MIEIPTTMKIIWGYFLLSTGFITIWPYYVPTYAPDISNIIGLSEARSIIEMIIFPVVIFMLPKKYIQTLISGLILFMTADAVYLLLDKKPFFDATSFDGAVIACMIPFLNLKNFFHILILMIYVAAIAITKSRTGAFIVGTFMLVNALQYFYIKFSKTKATFFSALLFLLALLPVWIFEEKIFSDARFEMWGNFYDWWIAHANIAYGIGIGSFEWTGPSLYAGKFFQTNHIGFWMVHNDWVQMLIEGGVIGLILMITGYLIVAAKLRGKDLSAWLAIGAGAFFYYIWHAFPIQFISLILIRKSFNRAGPVK